MQVARVWVGLLLWAVAVPAAAQSGLTLGRALQAALAANPDVRIVDVRATGAAGAVTQARGIYDPLFTAFATRADDNRPLTTAEGTVSPLVSSQYSRSSTIGLGLEQKTASGLSVFGTASAAYNEDRVSESVGLPSQATGRVALGVRLPLARGSGEQFVEAGIRAAERELDAANAQRRYTISLAMRETAAAYWEYVARSRQLEIARAGERRTATLVDEMRRLLAADEIPAADLDLAIANATERASSRIAAEQALLDARQALGRLMGVDPVRLAAIPPPVNEFPPAAAALPESARIPVLVEDAEKRRDDLRAHDLRIEAARERILVARDGARPLVDVTISVGGSGLREGSSVGTYANPFNMGGSGPSVAVQLGAQYPFGNRVAEGQIVQATANATDLEIRRATLRTEIAAGVTSAADGLRRTAQQLATSRNLVGHYTKALESERSKRRLGMSTLIDVIAVEDRLQNTQLADVDRQRNYAIAVARLKHELGALLRPGTAEFEIREEDFLEYRVQ
jgi:outer membrane protein